MRLAGVEGMDGYGCAGGILRSAYCSDDKCESNSILHDAFTYPGRVLGAATVVGTCNVPLDKAWVGSHEPVSSKHISEVENIVHGSDGFEIWFREESTDQIGDISTVSSEKSATP